MKMLEFYLELEALRFSNKFTYHFSIDENVNRESTQIPTLLLQPYVENAVIHGLLNKQSGGHLEITMSSKADKIFCVIADNGIGREAATLIKNKKFTRHESLGMKVTEERMQILEQITNRSAKVKILDLKDEFGNALGTKVEIEISMEY